MKNSLFLLAIGGLLLLSACERTNDNPASTPDYYQLKTGNYWVYQVQEITDDTSILTRPGTDSVFVEKDTVINKIAYSKIVGNNWPFSDFQSVFFYRDSIGYLVDQKGNILFSVVNSKDILYASNIHDFVRISYKMDAGDSVVSVPAGSFSCLFNRCTITPIDPSYNLKTKTQGSFRAEGIGIITQSAVNVQGNFRIRENLIRYHVVK